MFENDEPEEVIEGVFVGDVTSCRPDDDKWAVVHACKHPCHKEAIGYDGYLDSSHEDYLFCREEHDLYLNMVDANEPKYFGDKLFEKAMAFMHDH